MSNRSIISREVLSNFNQCISPMWIGFDRIFDGLDAMISMGTSEFPPYNLDKIGNKYHITLPVHGRTKENIRVEQTENQLVVNVEAMPKVDSDIKSIHNGLALRAYTQKYKLHDYMRIIDATVENGLLRITLEYVIPEEKKPKVIEIN